VADEYLIICPDCDGEFLEKLDVLFHLIPVASFTKFIHQDTIKIESLIYTRFKKHFLGYGGPFMVSQEHVYVGEIFA